MIVCYSLERFSVGPIVLVVGGRNQRSDIEFFILGFPFIFGTVEPIQPVVDTKMAPHPMAYVSSAFFPVNFPSMLDGVKFPISVAISSA